MVLKGFPRISEAFISNEIALLEEQGIEVRIFSMRHPREAFAHDSVARIKARATYLPENLLTGLPRLLPAFAAVALSRPRRVLAALRFMLARLGRTRAIATVKHFLQACYLVRRMDGVGHLHAHFAHSPTSVASFASLLSGVLFSFTAHAKDIYTQDPERLADKLGMAAFVLTCTEANRRYLERLNRTGTQVRRIYHGIDTALFSRRLPPPRPAPPYAVLTVARLARKKGVDTVLRALRLLRDEGITFAYTLIGDGEERERLLGLARELGLADAVRWLGTRDHAAVLRSMEEAHVFVLGCRVAENGDRDGIPNVLAESLAMELPVVATAVSALPELILDGETGLLVPPDNPGAMALAVRRMLTDEALRARVGREGRRLVEARFDNRRLAAELAAIFREKAFLGPADARAHAAPAGEPSTV